MFVAIGRQLRHLRRSRAKEQGVTIVEYAILGALVLLVAVLAIGGVGGKVTSTMQNVESKFTPDPTNNQR